MFLADQQAIKSSLPLDNRRCKKKDVTLKTLYICEKSTIVRAILDLSYGSLTFRAINKKGESYVVDNRCGIDSSVGTRVGKQLHDGRVYPSFDRDRDRRGADQDHPGKKDPEVVMSEVLTLSPLI